MLSIRSMMGSAMPDQDKSSGRPMSRSAIETLAARVRLRFYNRDGIDPTGSTMVPDPDLVPPILNTWLSVFRLCFTAPVRERVLILAAGAVLAPGKRTVTQALRVMGPADEAGFRRYHEALSRARWASEQAIEGSRAIARRLLLHIIKRLLADGEVVIGIDDTIERGWGYAHQGPRDLFRPGAILQGALRRNQQPALAVADGLCADTMLGADVVPATARIAESRAAALQDCSPPVLNDA